MQGETMRYNRMHLFFWLYAAVLALAASSPRSISPLSTLVSRVPCRPVFWLAIPLWT